MLTMRRCKISFAITIICCNVSSCALVVSPKLFLAKRGSRHALPSQLPRLKLSSVDEGEVRSRSLSYEDALETAKGMRLSQLQSVLKDMGVNTRGMLEKTELAEAYARAMVDAGRSNRSRGETSQGASDSGSTAAASLYEEAQTKASQMRLSQLQQSLREMGVNTRGMFEKTELVDAYARAISDGIRSGSTRGESSDSSGPVRELKTTKMTSESGDDSGASRRPPSGSFPDLDNLGSIGGIDLGSLLSGLGSTGGFGASNSPGGGSSSLQALMQRAMANPKLMATIQKAAQNPKMMAAVQDVMANGPGAANKYANDPEIRGLLEQLKDIL